MSDRDLKIRLTLRDAEIIRLNDVIILLENMCRELRESCADLHIVSKSFAKENAEYKKKEVAEEISQIKIKVLLDELQKIDPLAYT